MTDTFQSLDIVVLKELFEEKRQQLEAAEHDPARQRALYRELKALQYEISMKEVTKVFHSLGA